MMVNAVPKIAIGIPLLIIPIFLIIGLFIFAIVKSGKGKGLLVALGVVSLTAAVLLGALFSFRLSVPHAPQPIRQTTVQITSDSAIRHEGMTEEELFSEDELVAEGGWVPPAEVYQRPRRGFVGSWLLIAVFVMIGLFIAVVSKFGKDKPALIPLCVAGFVAAILGAVFFLKMEFMFVPMFLIPGVLILGLIVAAAIKSGKGKALLVVLGIGGAVAVGLVLMLTLNFFDAPVRHTAEAVQMPGRLGESSHPAIWHPGMKEFLADVYPSKRAAVLALGRQVTETIIQPSLADARISREIGLLQDDHDRGLLTELARQIEQYSTQESITCRVFQNIDSSKWDADSDNSVGQLKLWVRLSFGDVQTQKLSWSDEVSSGKVSLKVKGPEGISSTGVRFEEKPWVESFPDFLSSNPSRDLALARSGDSCITRQEAHRQAVGDAVMKISQMLRSVQNDWSIMPANMGITENDLSSGKFIADTFTQRFSGLAGPIWREAILIDTSQNRLNKLAEQKITSSHTKRLDWAKMAGTLIGMFALICVVYLFLNAATRGYYAWSLRIVLMAVLGIGVFLFLILS